MLTDTHARHVCTYTHARAHAHARTHRVHIAVGDIYILLQVHNHYVLSHSLFTPFALICEPCDLSPSVLICYDDVRGGGPTAPHDGATQCLSVQKCA